MSIQESDVPGSRASPTRTRARTVHPADQNLQIADDDLSFDVELGYPAKSQIPALRQALVAAARTVPGVGNVSVNVVTKVQAHGPAWRAADAGVKNIVGVASAGAASARALLPSTWLALAAEGAAVGVLDADIYGPSMPILLGVSGKPESLDGKSMEPLQNHGVQVSSIGFLVDPDEAMVWRGPMATQALEQLLRHTNWRELDYLIVDLPPGTGDIQLTLSQRVPMTGAVIVTTPQDIALADARKGVTMFEKVGVPILGLVENMAVHVCQLRARRAHLARGRQALRRGEGPGLPGRAAAGAVDPRTGRFRPADGGGRPGRRGRGDLQEHRAPGGDQDRGQGQGLLVALPVDQDLARYLSA